MKKISFVVLFLSVFIFGFSQWSSDPSQNLRITDLSGEQTIPKIARCANGNYYIGFFSMENGNYNVRLQLLDKDGNLLWPFNGILVSSHPSMTWLTDWDITADPENHAVLVWQDIRTGNNNIVACRIAPDGQFIWGNDGILLSNNSNFNVSPKVVALPGGDVVVAWQSSNVIYRQRLTASGQKLWGENGIELSGTGTFSWPQLLPASSGDVYMKYFIDSGPPWAPTRKIYVMRINPQGNNVWPSPVEIYNLGSISAWTQILPMIPDGNDGFYITWHDYSFNNNAATSRINRITSTGQLVFNVNGLPISLQHNSNQLYPMPAKPSDDPNIYAFWLETNVSQNNWGIYGQKISANGTLQWGDFGKEIIPVSSQYVNPVHVDNVGEDFIIFYQFGYTSTQYALHAIRVNKNGQHVWSAPAIISNVQSSKMHTEVSPYGNDQWVLTWGDDRFQSPDIFAQNIKSDGTLGPVVNDGILTGLVTVEGQMLSPHLITISAGSHTTHPDTLGLYSMELPSGVYSVSLTHPWIQSIEVQNVEINPGQITNLDFPEVLLKRRDLTVRTILLSGEPLPGVLFAVTGPQISFIATTGDDGSYTEPQQPYGHYSGEAWPPSGGLPVVADTIIDDNNSELIFRFALSSIPSRLDNHGASLYPNPVKHDSRIVFADIMEGSPEIILSNTFGEIITRKIFPYGRYSSMDLADLTNIASLPSGMYCISISGLQEIIHLKFIIF